MTENSTESAPIVATNEHLDASSIEASLGGRFTRWFFAVIALYFTIALLFNMMSTSKAFQSSDGNPGQVLSEDCTKHSNSTTSYQLPSILIIVSTIPKFYQDRVTQIRATWGKRADAPHDVKLIFLGGAETDKSANMLPSDCVPGPTNVCCKAADEITIANNFFSQQEGSNIKWVFIVDDDVYILVDNLRRMIDAMPPDDLKANPNGYIYGVIGCGNEKCGGLCGGGGYFMTRHTMTVLGTKPPASKTYKSLREEFSHYYDLCGSWGDMAHSTAAKERGILLKPYPPRTYAWHVNPVELNNSLNIRRPTPWLYHYNAREDMLGLHNLVNAFGANEVICDNCDSAARGAGTGIPGGGR